jgi:arylsulfatase A-like enzyme
MPGPRFRIYLLVSALLLLWAVGAVVVIPALIRGAYGGNSPVSLLDSLITGQSTHPVEYYLSIWRRLAAALTAMLVGVALLAALAWRFRAALGAASARTLRRSPTIGAVDVVAIGAWIGMAGGLLEAVTLTVRLLLNADPREAPSVDTLWMAPLAAGALGALSGAVLALILRGWRGVTIGLPTALFSGLALFAVLAGLRLGLHKWALLVLVIGAAMEFARRAHAHGAAFASFSRRALPWGTAAIAGLALVFRGWEFAGERLARSRAGTYTPNAPNVLLLILDTVRAQSLGLYGYARNTSPGIDQLAASGVTFDRAVATSPWTLPSHGSMFTGLLAHQLSTDFDEALDESAPTLAEVLRDRGFHTGGFVANLVFTTRAGGLDRGFSTYRDDPITWRAAASSARWTRQLTQFIRVRLKDQGLLVRKTAEVVNRDFLDWLPNDGRPFFAFLNYFDAHHPYETHPPFDLAFSDHPPEFWRMRRAATEMPPRDLEEVRNAYDSAIAYVDAQVDVLLEALRARGVLDNTIVILTSDHGELLGEHGMLSHGNGLYLPLLNVPLVISAPARIPAGKRVSQVVGIQDIAATVLDLVDSPDTLPGRSLARFWAGSADSAGVAAAPGVLSQLTPNNFAHKDDPIRRGLMHSLLVDSLHYIRNGDGVEELYDVVADREEGRNLATTPAGISALPELRRLMDDLLAQQAHESGRARTSRRN